MNVHQVKLTCIQGILVCALASGCGTAVKQAMQAEKNDLAKLELRELVLAYHNYCDLHQRNPPKSLAEFEEAAGQIGISESVLQKMRDGSYVVIWDAPVFFYPEGQHHRMPLAYQRGVPENGGVVVSGGGTASVMTAEEFATAPKFSEFPPKQRVAQSDATTTNAASGTGNEQPVSLGAYDGPASVPSTDRPVIAVTALYPGMIVQARDTGGWFAADVLEVLPDGSVKVHYRGWGRMSNKTLSLDDVQLAPDDVPQPAKP